MKKTKVKRIMAALMAVTISCGMVTNPVLANSQSGNEIITPYFTAIETTLSHLILTDNVLTAKGNTLVTEGYTASIIVELQKSTDGKNWYKATQWTDTCKNKAEVLEKYTAISGYYYRIKSTHKAYDSNGKLLESQVKYSNVVK